MLRVVFPFIFLVLLTPALVFADAAWDDDQWNDDDASGDCESGLGSVYEGCSLALADQDDNSITYDQAVAACVSGDPIASCAAACGLISGDCDEMSTCFADNCDSGKGVGVVDGDDDDDVKDSGDDDDDDGGCGCSVSGGKGGAVLPLVMLFIGLFAFGWHMRSSKPKSDR